MKAAAFYGRHNVRIVNLCIDPGAFLRRNGIGRVSTVIECVGSVHTIRQAIQIAGKKSVAMMFGLTKPNDEIPIKPFTLFEKEIVLKASYINPYTMPRAVRLIAPAGSTSVPSHSPSSRWNGWERFFPIQSSAKTGRS